MTSLNRREITLLVDMDDVSFLWGEGFHTEFGIFNPGVTITGQQDRTGFDMYLPEDAAVHHLITEQMNRPGFYERLQPAPGAIQALNEMVDDGYDVGLLSSPYLTNPTCASDKYASIDRHFGPGWAERLILSKDKTRVRGSFLFDDKPSVSGHFIPTWEHILVSQPHNGDVTDKRRIDSLADWRSVVETAGSLSLA
jgi:5'-nucleotidase